MTGFALTKCFVFLLMCMLLTSTGCRKKKKALIVHVRILKKKLHTNTDTHWVFQSSFIHSSWWSWTGVCPTLPHTVPPHPDQSSTLDLSVAGRCHMSAFTIRWFSMTWARSFALNLRVILLVGQSCPKGQGSPWSFVIHNKACCNPEVSGRIFSIARVTSRLAL